MDKFWENNWQALAGWQSIFGDGLGIVRSRRGSLSAVKRGRNETDFYVSFDCAAWT